MKYAMTILVALLGLSLGAWPAAAEENATATAVQVLGDGPEQLNIGIGIFNVANGSNTPLAARLEWRSGRKLLRLGPLLGVLANVDEGLFAYGGIYLDIAWRQVIMTPMSSLGAYRQGEGKDLGGTLQFRSAFELAWRHAGGWRIGVQSGHISNANLHHSNAGENDIFLTFALPF